VVSYGPCQTPTLNFTVERHQAIVAFQPEPYWGLKPLVSKVGGAWEGSCWGSGGRRRGGGGGRGLLGGGGGAPGEGVGGRCTIWRVVHSRDDSPLQKCSHLHALGERLLRMPADMPHTTAPSSIHPLPAPAPSHPSSTVLRFPPPTSLDHTSSFHTTTTSTTPALPSCSPGSA
jgi:hypothetical protein